MKSIIIEQAVNGFMVRTRPDEDFLVATDPYVFNSFIDLFEHIESVFGSEKDPGDPAHDEQEGLQQDK